MVTLQILVLSFLVRIQVAQLKTIFARGSFFLFVIPSVVVGLVSHCVRLLLSPLCPDASIVQVAPTTEPRLFTKPIQLRFQANISS